MYFNSIYTEYNFNNLTEGECKMSIIIEILILIIIIVKMSFIIKKNNNLKSKIKEYDDIQKKKEITDKR